MIKELQKVIKQGCCNSCGTCVALDASCESKMIDTPYGPIPLFSNNLELPEYIKDACPSLGINYPDLYKYFYKKLPDNWLLGSTKCVRTGYSSVPQIRAKGSSGGVITQTLIYLLENKLIDAAILAKQGIPKPDKARAYIARTVDDIIDCSQSIYIPVSMLDILKDLNLNEKYAITCLPDQSASLRVLQKNKYLPALSIKYILGPYTGTAIYPQAIRCFLRSKKVKIEDEITSLKWRAGDWPGYLEIKLRSGIVIRTPKVYYNYLIPFFITKASLQSMDFVNEFADLAVGDAWSPKFENMGGGHSVVVTRTSRMEKIISDMVNKDLLVLKKEDPIKALDMHGHMLDFKKRGGFIRNKIRKALGLQSPDNGYSPVNIPLVRIFVEIIISSIFLVGQLSVSRWLISKFPESFIGPIFNKLRLLWKRISRPTKRKGLAKYNVIINK